MKGWFIMKKSFLLLTVLCCLLVFCTACAENASLTVSGRAVITLPADYVTLNIGVETQDKDVAAAQRRNTELVNAVTAALKALGADEKDLTTGSLNVYSSWRYETGSDGTENQIQVYHVSCTLNVTVRSMEETGNYIDTAILAGANQLYGLSYASGQASEAYMTALARACENARAKAEVIAGACGMQLGKIESITARDSSEASAARITAAKALADEAVSGAGTVIQAGDVTVEASVEIVYTLKK